MGTTRWRDYAFTDPLSVAGGSDARPAAWLARRALIALYAIGAVTLGLTLLTPDSDPSDHTGIAVVAVLMVLVALMLRLWRSPPALVLLACFAFGSVAITGLVAVARPIALIPMFYIWPQTVSAYFLQRREVVGMLLLTAAGFAAALVGWVTPDARLIQWLSVVVVTAVLGGLVVLLKEGLDTVVQRLRLLATRDPLTGALNRRAFQEALNGAVARAARGAGTCSVAIIDVDHFKRINDAFGHAAGDRALVHLTEVLGLRARRQDAIGRLGGEEFAVLLDGTDAAGAVRYGEDLRAQLADASAPDVPRFTVSLGVAELAPGAHDAGPMLVAADRALYAAKEGGRDQVVGPADAGAFLRSA
jgi:diguanylate cyclase (GGDEF)-like protein